MFTSWIVRLYALLPRFCPYAACALFTPGGGIIVALLWIYGHRLRLYRAISLLRRTQH
jgi:hypothetical protein